MSVKAYSIRVPGFSAMTFRAETAGKAKYAAFRAWREAGYGRRRYPDHGETPFLSFLKLITILHMGR